MHYLLSFYLTINVYMFRARFTSHHQEVLLCIYSKLVYAMPLCLLAVGRIGVLAGSQHKKA